MDSPWYDLPSEILWLVMVFADIEDIKRQCSIDTRMANICRNPVFWVDKVLNDFGQVIPAILPQYYSWYEYYNEIKNGPISFIQLYYENKLITRDYIVSTNKNLLQNLNLVRNFLIKHITKNSENSENKFTYTFVYADGSKTLYSSKSLLIGMRVPDIVDAFKINIPNISNLTSILVNKSSNNADIALIVSKIVNSYLKDQ